MMENWRELWRHLSSLSQAARKHNSPFFLLWNSLSTTNVHWPGSLSFCCQNSSHAGHSLFRGSSVSRSEASAERMSNFSKDFGFLQSPPLRSCQKGERERGKKLPPKAQLFFHDDDNSSKKVTPLSEKSRPKFPFSFAAKGRPKISLPPSLKRGHSVRILRHSKISLMQTSALSPCICNIHPTCVQTESRKMSLYSLLLASLFLVSASCSTNSAFCPDGWIEGPNSNCYLIPEVS